MFTETSVCLILAAGAKRVRQVMFFAPLAPGVPLSAGGKDTCARVRLLQLSPSSI